MQAHTARMVPAMPAEIAVELEKTAALFDRSAGAFMEENAAVYFEALKAVPAPLLRAAFMDIRIRHRIPAMPLPGEILASVDDKWKQWISEGGRIKAAARQVNVLPANRPETPGADRHAVRDHASEPGVHRLADVLRRAAAT